MRGIKKEKTPLVRIDKEENSLSTLSNVDLLKQIADNTTKSNELILQINGSIKKYNKKENISFDKPIKYVNNNFDVIKKNKLNDNIVSIADNIQEIADFINRLDNKEIKSTKDITSLTKKSMKKDENNTTSLTKVGRKVGGDSLKNIELYVFKILSNLEKKVNKKEKQNKKETGPTELKISELSKASKEFEKIGTSIDKKAIRGLKTFQREVEQMSKPKFVSRLKGLNAVMHDFSGKISEISRQMSNAVVSLKEFIRLIGLTAVSLLAPQLEKGVKRFTDMFSNVNTKIAESKKSTKTKSTYKELLVGLSIGLTAVVGSLLLVKYVSFGDIAKMIGFLAALFGVLSLFNLSRRGIARRPAKQIGATNITNIKGDNMLTAFAFGLGVLVIAFAAVKEVDWKGPAIMLGFISTLLLEIALFNKFGGGIGPGKGMFGFALGIGVLVIAVEAMNEVFANSKEKKIGGLSIPGTVGTLGILAFVFALGLASRIAGGGGFKGMLGLSLGIGLLVLCADAAGEVFLKTQEKKILGVNWIGTVGTLGLIAFTYAMAGAIRYASGGKHPITKNTILGFTLSILAILFVVKRSTKLVDKYGFGAVIGGATVIAGFTFVMTRMLFNVNTSMKGLNKKTFLEKIGVMSLSIMMLAGTVALLMWTISSIDLSGVAFAQFSLLTIGMIGMFIGLNEYITTKKVTPKQIEKTRNMMLNIALSFVALSVPMMLLSYVDVKWETLAQLGVSILVLSGVAIALGIPAVSVLVETGVRSLMKISGVLAVLSLSFLMIGQIKDPEKTWQTLGQMGVCLLGLGLIAAALGIPVVAPFVTLGSGVLITLSIAFMMISLTMKSISALNIKTNTINNFASSLKKLVQTIALITPAAVIASVGTIPIGLVSIACLGVATTLAAIQSLSIDNKKLEKFSSSIKSLVNGITDIKLKDIIEGATKAPKIKTLSESCNAVANTFKSIQDINLQEGTITSFTGDIKSIVETFKTMNLEGLNEQTKIISPVMEASKNFAIALKEIQNLTIKPEQTKAFCESLGTFIGTFSDEIQATVGKMKQMEPGIEALTKIASLPKTLAEGITSVANMNFTEYENKEGQLIEKSKRKLTPDEIKQASINFGTMLGMLIDPISKIGGAKEGEIIKIGNSDIETISKSKRNKANEFIKSLGENYQPFFDVTQSILDKAEILSDNQKSTNIVNNFNNLLGALMTSSDNLKNYKILDLEQTNKIKAFSDFTSTIKINPDFQKDLNSYNKNTYSFFDNVAKIMERMESSKIDPKSPKLDVLNSFAEKLNNLKWNNINNGLSKVNGNVEKIIKNINSLQLQKVIKLNDTLKYLSQNNTSNNIAECVEKINELIDTIKTYQEQEEKYNAIKIKSQEEAKVLQQQIAKNSGKPIDVSTLQALLKNIVNDLQGLNVEIGNDEGNPISVYVEGQNTSSSRKNSFASK